MQGLSTGCTDTSETNTPLIALFERRGYRIVPRDEAKGMVRLARSAASGR